jgi:Ca-activated chloride channel family protein
MLLHKFSIFFFFLLFTFFSCSRVAGKLLIMEGNFYQAQGVANKAIVSYLKASAIAEAKPYADFGLGTVYYNLDERDAALARFASAESLVETDPKTEYRVLLSRIQYNTGVILFEKGRYSEAAGKFRRALEADSAFVEAKRNLELSLLAQDERKNAPESAAQELKKVENAKTEALFDYVRERESRQWKSQEWIGEDSTDAGADY